MICSVAPPVWAADVKPRGQSRGHQRNNRKDDQKNLARPDLLGGAERNGPGVGTLALHHLVYRLLELLGFGLCRHEGTLHLALGIELARAQRDDAALAGYCRETAVNRGQSLALLGIREGLEVGLDLALRRIHQLS